MKKSILVIPTDYIDIKNMKVRIIEFAFGLQDYYDVYLLTWNTVLSRKIFPRFAAFFKDLFRPIKIKKKYAINLVQLPMLRHPFFLSGYFNSFFVNRFIRKKKIDVVLNGSYYMFNIDKNDKIKYVFDLGDLPIKGGKNNNFDRFLDNYVQYQLGKADLVTAVSNNLAGYIKKKYKKEAVPVYNGVYIEKVRSVDKNKIIEVKNKYRLNNKWIIGYIGLIGHWVMVDLLVEAFKIVKKDMQDAVLVLIGSSPYLEKMRKKYKDEDIVITGNLEGEAEVFINMFDIGILPHEKNLCQDLAFHIKLLEYTAARKVVVATDLDETRSLDYPNIILAKPAVEDWSNAIKKARLITWDSSWDTLCDNYSWDNIVRKLYNNIESIDKPGMDRSCDINKLLINKADLYAFKGRPCPLCNSGSYKPMFKKAEYGVVKCNKCGLSYLQQAPSGEEIDSLYAEKYYRSYISLKKCKISEFDKRLKWMGKYIASGRLLDIGCELGIFLELAKERGWMVEGIEISGFAKNYIEKRSICPVRKSIKEGDYPKDSFDAVTMWHTLEHIPDFINALYEIKTILKPGGFLFIEVPNINFIQNKIFNAINIDKYLLLKEHVTHFSPDTLCETIKTAGFQLEGITAGDIAVAKFNLRYLFDMFFTYPSRFIYYITRVNMTESIRLAAKKIN